MEAGFAWRDADPGLREESLVALECLHEVGVADIPLHGGREERMRWSLQMD